MAVKRREIYYQLWTLAEAGIPIGKAMNTVTSPMAGRQKEIFENITKTVTTGNTLTETIKKYPSQFAALDNLIIESSEYSGNLPDGFKILTG